MADFNVNLSGPQAQGAQVVEAVRPAVAQARDFSGIGDAVTIFAKKLGDSKKADAEARKNAVLKEYEDNENVYTDALTSGQWNAAQVGMASRANYQKLRASYPEYMKDLAEAKRSRYDGTETGEAQKQVDREIAAREDDIKQASGRGYTFYPGMSEDAKNKTIDASKYGIRLEKETEQRYKANTEARAALSADQATESHTIKMNDEVEKVEATRGLVTLADKNFEGIWATVKDLTGNTSMNYEQKLMVHSENINRVKQGLLMVASARPELAAPYQKLVDDMDLVGQKLLDPKMKGTTELDVLKTQWETLQVKAKLAAVISNPQLMKYVTAGQIFNEPGIVSLHGGNEISAWLAGAGSGDPKHTPAPMVGTPNEKKALKVLEDATNNVFSGKIPDVEKGTQEAVNAANQVLKQTKALNQGGISPSALKDLGTFFSSSAFGKLATTGKVNMQDLQGAKEVFQVSYVPAVTQAIMQRMDETIETAPQRNPGPGGHGIKSGKMSEMIDIQFSGAGVVFKDKPGSFQTIGSSFSRDGIQKAQAGLNQLIRIGAHMEGTTDYQKYWEGNRHLLMPGYYMKDVPDGAVRNGYKYLGGDARNQKSWEKVKKDE